MHLLLLTVINSAEPWSVAQRPIHRISVDAEDGFQLVEQVHRRAGRAVQLIHESENRHSTTAADFEKFPRLTFDPLTGIHHHHSRVHGSEHAVGVLGEIFVARRIEDVDDAVLVFELQDGGAHRDTALFFEVHPVRGRRALVFPSSDATG